jgi:hypothetical protein
MKMPRKQSEAMTEALAAIMSKKKSARLTPPQAAVKFGVALNSIYRRPQYKSWKEEQDRKTQS